MAHEHESSLHVRISPWHGLGLLVDEHPESVHEAMRLSGTNWKVAKRPLTTTLGDRELEVPGHFAVVREKDGRVYTVVTKQYGLIQNEDAFNVYDPLVRDGSLKIETIGSLVEGRYVWMLMSMGGSFEPIKGDVVNKYVLALLSHDGTRAFHSKWTGVRVVCKNTVDAAMREKSAGPSFVVRHTVNAKDRVAHAREAMGLLTKQERETEELYREMARHQLDRKALEAYLVEVIPDNPKSADKSRTVRARNEILEFAESGAGTEIKGVRGSLWGAYNAVVEWVDWGRGSVNGPDQPTKNLEARLTNMTLGSGARIKARAMREAVGVLR